MNLKFFKKICCQLSDLRLGSRAAKERSRQAKTAAAATRAKPTATTTYSATISSPSYTLASTTSTATIRISTTASTAATSITAFIFAANGAHGGTRCVLSRGAEPLGAEGARAEGGGAATGRGVLAEQGQGAQKPRESVYLNQQ